MEIIDILAVFMGGCLSGLCCAAIVLPWMVDKKWRDNAEVAQRIYSNGRFFKVYYAD